MGKRKITPPESFKLIPTKPEGVSIPLTESIQQHPTLHPRICF